MLDWIATTKGNKRDSPKARSPFGGFAIDIAAEIRAAICAKPNVTPDCSIAYNPLIPNLRRHGVQVLPAIEANVESAAACADLITPLFTVEPTEHPLAVDQRNSISIDRWQQIAHQLLYA